MKPCDTPRKLFLKVNNDNYNDNNDTKGGASLPR